jgi:hypothetical protein
VPGAPEFDTHNAGTTIAGGSEGGGEYGDFGVAAAAGSAEAGGGGIIAL